MGRYLCLAGILLAASQAAPAAGDDYTYIQGDWIADADAELGAATGEADGFAVEGSYAVIPALFLQADYSELEDDAGDAIEFTRLGIGARHGLGGYIGEYAGYETDLDIYAVASYEDLDTDINISGDGYGLSGGLRWKPVANLEINPSVGYVDYGELDDSIVEADGFRYALRALLGVTERFAVSAEFRMTKLELNTPGPETDFDIEDEIRVGGRLYF